MQAILSIAIVTVLITTLVLVWRWRSVKLTGQTPTRLFAFFAILCTSGLDVGLIMLPLTEFSIYESEYVYGFTNPLAIEFGFWGFMIWSFYFLTTIYFCIVEPHVKIFEIKAIKLINVGIIVATCAFTGYLFLTSLPIYIEGITQGFRYAVVALVVFFAVFSSTDVRYVKMLSLSSTWLFLFLIFVMWLYSDIGLIGLVGNLMQIGGYFSSLHEFILPISEQHTFYLFWWFAWSIMIGQFVARFLGGLRTWELLLALLIIPSIPIAVWFSVLFGIYEKGQKINDVVNMVMVFVGMVFVINSLDSLTRLYTEIMDWTVNRVGRWQYVASHWALLYSLILLYQFTPLEIEWIGLLVIALYVVVAILVTFRRKRLIEISSIQNR